MLKNSLLVLLSLLFSVQVLSASELRVAMSADYPPLHFKQDGKFYGVEPDNARALGEITRRRIRIVELPFAELIPALLEGKVDMDITHGLEPGEIEHGFILTCQAHPISDKVVVDFDQK